MRNTTVLLMLVGLVVLVVSGTLFYLRQSRSLEQEIGLVVGESAISQVAPAYWIKIIDPTVTFSDGFFYLDGKTGQKADKSITVFLGTESSSMGFAQTNQFNLSENPNAAENFDPWTIELVERIELADPRSRVAIVKIYSELPSKPADCDDECELFLQNLSNFLSENIRANNIEEVNTQLVIGPASQILFIE